MDDQDKMQQLKELRSFLEKGYDIGEAATFAGLELEDAIKAIVEWRVHQAYDKDVLRESSKNAVVIGMKALKSLAESAESEDVQAKAATELVKFALTARKMMVENSVQEKETGKSKSNSLWKFLPTNK